MSTEGLERLSSAESLFPSPIPVQSVSYEKHGAGRTNLAYGYALKNS
jgi:hypothetical protein